MYNISLISMRKEKKKSWLLFYRVRSCSVVVTVNSEQKVDIEAKLRYLESC